MNETSVAAALPAPQLFVRPSTVPQREQPRDGASDAESLALAQLLWTIVQLDWRHAA